MARAESFKTVLILLVALVGLACVEATTRSPKVQVYTRYPLGSSEPNFLNCFVDGFHPPKIDIQLLKNGKPMEGMIKGDLSFKDDWTFQRLVSAPFTPNSNDIYSCSVNHISMQHPKDVKWDPDN
ncbi:PREDICTED: beta-2-microglobulin [Gavialis gangeticus]|uniref:beta-2-microglobulin n=1 Tax=Gavialis gangeticus TaxID=94835 RepID=UPI00092EBE0E|nr:PREDICTED: beta-2-microglobulin [Gavialis gangeticus]